MNKESVDRRKLSGKRVLAKCEVELPLSDPFAYYCDNVKSGYIVLNIRGGSLYLANDFTKENFFPDGETNVIKKLTLMPKNKPEIVIKNIKVAFIRIRKGANRDGIVFRFIDISEEHLDILETLRFKLPVISSSEESSVPFEEIIDLDRSDILYNGEHFELL